MKTRINCISIHKRIKPYTFGGLGMVSEVSVDDDVFSSLDGFLEFVVSGVLDGFVVFDAYVLLDRLEGFIEFTSFEDFAGVSQFF